MKQYVVITRPEQESKDIVEQLRKLDIPVFLYPTITTEKTIPGTKEISQELLDSADWIIFTSVNGIRHFADTLKELGIDPSSLNGRLIGAVGPKTAAEVRKYGLTVEFVPSKFTTAQLGKELPEIAGKTILIPRSAIANKSLNNELKKKGAKVIDIPIYTTRYISKDRSGLERLLADGQIKCITFTSPSTVTGFVNSMRSDYITKVRSIPVVSIGPVTTAAVKEAGFKNIHTAEPHTIEGMVLQLQEL